MLETVSALIPLDFSIFDDTPWEAAYIACSTSDGATGIWKSYMERI